MARGEPCRRHDELLAIAAGAVHVDDGGQTLASARRQREEGGDPITPCRVRDVVDRDRVVGVHTPTIGEPQRLRGVVCERAAARRRGLLARAAAAAWRRAPGRPRCRKGRGARTQPTPRRLHNRRVDGPRMVFLGFGKYARADKIYALEPLPATSGGSGRRTRVWVEGIPEPIVASPHRAHDPRRDGPGSAVGTASSSTTRSTLPSAWPSRPPTAGSTCTDLGRRARRLLEATAGPPRPRQLFLSDRAPPAEPRTRRRRAIESPGVRGASPGSRIDISPLRVSPAVPAVLVRPGDLRDLGGQLDRRRAAVPGLPADRLDARRRPARASSSSSRC